MAHSNQVREFLLTNDGIRLLEVYIGPGQLLVGSARINQEAMDETERQLRQQEVDSRSRELGRKQALLDARIAALQAEFEAEKEEVTRLLSRGEMTERLSAQGMAKVRSRRDANVGQQ
jgi:circadian clock protein KaiC